MDHRKFDLSETIHRLGEHSTGCASARLLFIQRQLAEHGIPSAWVEVRMQRTTTHPRSMAQWVRFWDAPHVSREEQTIYLLQIGERYWTVHGEEVSQQAIVGHYSLQGWEIVAMHCQNGEKEDRHYERVAQELRDKPRHGLKREIDALVSQVHAFQEDEAADGLALWRATPL